MAKKDTKDVVIIEEEDTKKKSKAKDKKKEEAVEVLEEVQTEEKIVEEDEIVMQSSEPIKEEVKKEKKRRFWDEVKSFFILIIIIGLVVLGGWLFIKYAEPIEWNKKNKTQEEVKVGDTKDYNVVSYTKTNEEGSLEVINNKYLIEYSENYVAKIMDLELNVLYEATEEEEYNFVEGINGKLYGITTGEADDSLILNLYVLENEKIVEVKEFSKMGVYYVPLYTDNYLVGIVGNYCYLDDELNDTCESEIFTLDEESKILEDFTIEGDIKVGSDNSSPLYTRNTKYVVVKNYLDNKYGLYDLTNHELIIKASYDDLYTTYNNSYVARKDNKFGIIDKKLKKLVEFDYDFIDIQRGYYILGKNNKLAIMDKEYKMVTGFDFSYENKSAVISSDDSYNYRNSLFDINSYVVIKFEDKYLLINKIKEQLGYTYIAENAYIIESKDSYKKIDIEAFGLEELLYSYSKNNGKLIIYDETLTEKTVIDLSDYDYDDYPTIELVNGNTIVVTMDSELYFDYESVEELTETQDAEFSVLDLTMKYSTASGKITVLDNEKEIVSYPYNPLSQNNPYILVDENSFYYLENDTYVYVQKR